MSGRRWHNHADGDAYIGTAVTGGRIYVSSSSGRLGAEAWRRREFWFRLYNTTGEAKRAVELWLTRHTATSGRKAGKQ